MHHPIYRRSLASYYNAGDYLNNKYILRHTHTHTLARGAGKIERRQCRVVHLLQKRVPTAFDLFRSVENLITAKMVFWFMYFSARLEGLSWLIGWANTNEWVQRRTDSAHLRVNQYYKHRWHHFNEIYCMKRYALLFQMEERSNYRSVSIYKI